jgi:hypothetical protein
MKLLKSTLSVLLAVALTGLSQAQSLQNKTPTVASRAKKATAPGTRYFGSVDLGSKGTKAALYSFVVDEDGPSADVLFTKTKNTTLVSSMKDGKFTAAGIADATSAVKEVTDQMAAAAKENNVTVETYYIVGSSGVAKGKNVDELIASVKQATGYDVSFVTAAEEGYYGLKSAVPLSRRPTSVYIDIGSGNTKLGCLVGGTDLSSFKAAEIVFGSASGANEAAKRNPTDVVAGTEAMAKDVTASYEEQSRNIPCLRNRPNIYWTGGAAWATATFTHPEKQMRGWVTITKRDLDKFLGSLKDGSWNAKPPVYIFPKDMPAARQAAIKAKSAKDRAEVQDIFVREQLIAGVSIMESVLASSNPNATIRFVRSGNFIYGYALEKFKVDAAQ